jgi:hypothetical protein
MSEPTNEQANKLNNHPATNRAKLFPPKNAQKSKRKIIEMTMEQMFD